MKLTALIFWLLFLLAVIGLIPEPIRLWIMIVGVMLLLSHAIEFLIFPKKINAKGDGPLKSFLMTMVFGVFYFK